MKDTTLAIRYAKAYIELALSRGQLEQAVEGAKAAAGFFDASPEARQVLVSPLIPASDKAEALSRVLGHGVPAEAQEFVRFVIGKGRAEFLPEILRQVGHSRHPPCGGCFGRGDDTRADRGTFRAAEGTHRSRTDRPARPCRSVSFGRGTCQGRRRGLGRQPFGTAGRIEKEVFVTAE